jgi:hypothetical protein
MLSSLTCTKGQPRADTQMSCDVLLSWALASLTAALHLLVSWGAAA